ncbi:MAG: peptidylprolyl isomerase [Aquificae bacterium]|nr:peptidylprolyl isomerase [Aquificota bacterium]
MKVEKDKVVKFHYVLKDKETGEILDSSYQYQEPLAFLVGAQNIIPGLEKQMEGMEEGEKKTIEVKSSEAYGEVNPNLIQKLPRSEFSGIELQKGMVLQAQDPYGNIIPIKVIDFNENEVVIDANHPLAGKDLVFEVEVVSVRDATPEEISHGHAHEGNHQH